MPDVERNPFDHGLYGEQASGSAQLEAVVVGRQFHAPLPTDLSGLKLQVVREPHNAVDPLVRQ